MKTDTITNVCSFLRPQNPVPFLCSASPQQLLQPSRLFLNSLSFHRALQGQNHQAQSLKHKLICLPCFKPVYQASLVAQMVKSLPAVQETWVQSLGEEGPLEKEMAAHSSVLAWKTPWIEEPGRVQSMGSQRVGHD